VQFGRFQLDILYDRPWALDAGAMFGIIPRALWEREVPTDEQHRMDMACNCPLIRTGEATILVDCGLGDKWNAKQRKIYRINDDDPHLLDNLKALGVSPEDITHMVLSHLHLDHAGWNARADESGNLVPTFPNAKYFVQKGEYDDAARTNEITRGTYFPANIEPIDEAGLWELIEGDTEIVPGVRVRVTGGHTKHHQIVTIDGGEDGTAIWMGEMMPTRYHRRLVYIMAYDLYPLETLAAKRALTREAVGAESLVLLDHDPAEPCGRLSEENGKVVWTPHPSASATAPIRS
jgi:glyoxylase-like metal-dependent hydrolase (beta-lactamase superfamily II)